MDELKKMQTMLDRHRAGTCSDPPGVGASVSVGVGVGVGV